MSENRVDAAPASFAELGLDPRLLGVLQELGYEEPTPIQRAAIPILREGRDLVGQAETGTGKTAAFALPLLERLTGDGAAGPQALVLVPTRELAIQVSEALHRYGRGMGASVLPVYGGQAIGQQLRALRRGVDVVVATPGRALDHLRRGSLTLDAVGVLVLDEADEMLDMGFAEDLEALLSATPATRQTILFSATLAPRVAALARRHLREPVTIEIPREAAAEGEMPRVPQTAYLVPRHHKLAALGRVLDMEAPTSAIVFCRTRTEVDELTQSLGARGYRAEALHGGLSQDQRDRVMRRFRAGTSELLVATDLAARGLDIPHVSHIVNYDVPASPEAYVHRIGRTGRAGRPGVALTLLEPRERRLLENIQRLTRQRIEVVTVPTVSDLRARQMQLTRTALEEALAASEHERFRVIVEALCETYDVLDIAAAAVQLAHEATGGATDVEEIPAAVSAERDRPGDSRPARGGREDRPPRAAPAWQVARIFIGAGKIAGVRPADLVGAIANESGLTGRAIGPIRISDHYSVVGVPKASVDDVVRAMASTTIRGKAASVRRFVE